MNFSKIMFVVALAGCTTVGPDYQRPEIAVPGEYPEAAAKGEPSIPADWWTLFNDAQLNDLVQSACKDTAGVRVAAARVQEAAGVLREARALIYPDVSAGVSATRNRVSERTVPPPLPPLERTTNQLLLSTTYEIDFWGRYARGDEAARAALLSSLLSRDTVLLTLAGATSQAYFALRSLDAQL